MKVINLWGGPGSGKSTTASGLFYTLKLADLKCELITEVAKDETYEKNTSRMSNQVYLLGEQYQRLHRVRGSVNYAISDSPIVLGINYRSEDFPKSYDQLCVDLFNQFDNLNYFLVRTKKYQEYGRNQTEEQARQIDTNIKKIMKDFNIPFTEVLGDRNAVDNIIADICNKGETNFCSLM